MSLADRAGFVVRILRSGSDVPAGVGFVVDERHIITCAHVVNSALRQDKREQTPKPGDRVEIDFPLLDRGKGAPSRRCRVDCWEPPPTSGISGGDVAGLVILGDGLPTGAGPARLISNLPWDDHHGEQSVFGFPEDDPSRWQNGAWSVVHIRGPVGGGLLQLDKDSEAAIRAQPGYSGSPVIVADDAGDAGRLRRLVHGYGE